MYDESIDIDPRCLDGGEGQGEGWYCSPQDVALQQLPSCKLRVVSLRGSRLTAHAQGLLVIMC